MSSDTEDYDGDTNWDEIVAITETPAPQRDTSPIAERSMANPTSTIQLQSHFAPVGATSHVTTRASTSTSTTSTRQNNALVASGASQRTNDNRRRQAILSALSSGLDKPIETATLNKGKRKRSSEELGFANKQQCFVKSPSGDGIQKLLSGYDDELSCPICLDFFLSPQLLNPCGHTICGDCLDHWLSKSDNRQCPTCRAHLSHTLCHLPNFAIGGTVDRYIELQRANKEVDWLNGGAKWKEREARKRAYEVVKKMKKTKPIYEPRRTWGERLTELLATTVEPQRSRFTEPILSWAPRGRAPFPPAQVAAPERHHRTMRGLPPAHPPNTLLFEQAELAEARPYPADTNRRGNVRRTRTTGPIVVPPVIEISSDEDGEAGENGPINRLTGAQTTRQVLEVIGAELNAVLGRAHVGDQPGVDPFAEDWAEAEAIWEERAR